MSEEYTAQKIRELLREVGDGFRWTGEDLVVTDSIISLLLSMFGDGGPENQRIVPVIGDTSIMELKEGGLLVSGATYRVRDKV